MVRHGTMFRKYGTNKETIERWSRWLAKIYGRPFVIHKDIMMTIIEWSKLL